MLDVVVQFSPDACIRYISPSCLTMLGYAPDAFLGHSGFDYIHPDDRPAAAAAFQNAVGSGGGGAGVEYRIRHSGGHWVWVESVAKQVCDADGTPLGMVCSLRDITQRKQMEEQLKYQAVRDPVTGLYNRAHFETAMSRLSADPASPVGLIMCDLDGLKYVNDTLGHDAGDQLLRNAADLIRTCFSPTEIIARIGGDELAVIMPAADEQRLNACRNQIRAAVDDYNARLPKIPICISVGSAITGPALSVAGLFKEADNSMYREKLHSQQSSRSSVVQALKIALEARDFVTEGHATRLRDLTVNLAKMDGFPDYRLTDLRLFAEFHDIGKVGIPDQILFKPGPLTAEEVTVMRSHCEIGHRIAVSTPELEPIADWILKHHEWWNGRGYPLGLKGEDIPLECRILSIVDAYDAMTNDRPYRKAVSPQAALSEITACAGTQFDPGLVKKFVLMLKSGKMKIPAPAAPT
jgi:diguanylate cyclase (GGDEF)-like protein/PAS domain S-box-containing protein